jgi:hypothetical protein
MRSNGLFQGWHLFVDEFVHFLLLFILPLDFYAHNCFHKEFLFNIFNECLEFFIHSGTTLLPTTEKFKHVTTCYREIQICYTPS